MEKFVLVAIVAVLVGFGVAFCVTRVGPCDTVGVIRSILN